MSDRIKRNYRELMSSFRLGRFWDDYANFALIVEKECASAVGKTPSTSAILPQKARLLADYLSSGLITVPHFDFMVTSRCNLRCEECGNLMPYYARADRYDVDLDTFKKNVSIILRNVKRIIRATVFGGEIFLLKNIAEYIDYAASQDSITCLNIVTNATILPPDDALDAMSRHKDKIYVVISDYSPNVNTQKIPTFQEILNSIHIPSYVMTYPWYSVGMMGHELRTVKELRNLARNCPNRFCTIFFDDAVYKCGRSIFVRKYLGGGKDFVKIDENDQTLKKQLADLLLDPFIQSCAYCHYDMKKEIPRGVQRHAG